MRQTTTHWTKAASLLAGLCSTFLGGCDPDGYFPITAKEAGAPTVEVQIAMGTTGTKELPENVTDLRFDVAEVWLHEAESDRWTVVSSAPQSLTLADGEGEVPVGTVYLPKGTYDTVALYADAMLVETGGTWSGVFLEEDELLWRRPLEISDSGRMEIDVNVASGLSQEAPGWVGAPRIVVALNM